MDTHRFRAQSSGRGVDPYPTVEEVDGVSPTGLPQLYEDFPEHRARWGFDEDIGSSDS